MKLYAILLTLLLLACATDQVLPSMPETVRNAPEEVFNAQCDAPVDPQVMLDAFPSRVGSYVEVGETIAERSELPTPDGVTLQSSALRTLTVNDETYIAFTGTDACGFNMNVAQIGMMTEFESEEGWVRRTTINGRPAWIDFDSGLGYYNIYVLLGERVLIQVNGDSTQEDVVRAAEMVDYDAIEALI